MINSNSCLVSQIIQIKKLRILSCFVHWNVKTNENPQQHKVSIISYLCVTFGGNVVFV